MNEHKPKHHRLVAIAAVLTTVFTVLPLLLLSVAILANPLPEVLPTDDGALLELGIRDALQLERLRGPYSRFGMAHPGPMLFYTLAPVYAFGGETWASLAVGAALINAIAISGVLFWLGRQHPIAVPPAAILVLSALSTLGPEILVSPWNPALTIFPFLLFLSVLPAAVFGNGFAFVLAVLSATFCIQSHVGYLVPAFFVLLTACAIWWRFPSPRPRPSVGTLVTAAACLFVAWIPVIVDGPGNLFRLFSIASQSDQDTIGIKTSLGIILRDAFSFLPVPPIAAVVIGGSLLLATAVITGFCIVRNHHADFPLLAGLFGLVAIVAAVPSVTRIPGSPLPYLTWWLLAPGLAISIAATTWILQQLVNRSHGILTVLLSTICAMISIVVCGRYLPWSEHLAIEAPDQVIAREITHYVTRWADAEGVSTVRLHHGPGDAWIYATGLALGLDRAGIGFVPTPNQAFLYASQPNEGTLFGYVEVRAAETPNAISNRCRTTTLRGFDVKTCVLHPWPNGVLEPGEAEALPYLVSGFSGAEHDSEGSFRWTDGDVVVFFAPPPSEEALCLEVEAQPFHSLVPLAATVSLDSGTIQRLDWITPQTTRNTIRLDGAALARTPCISLQVGATSSPSKVESFSQDNRQLGLKVRSLRLVECDR